MAISNSKKNPNRHILAFERNSSKMISNLQRNHMGSFTINLGSQLYIFYDVQKGLIDPNNIFVKITLIGNSIASISNVFKHFQGFKISIWMSSITS